MNLLKLLLFSFFFVFVASTGFSQEVNNKDFFIKLNSPYSYSMMDPNENLRKVELLLDAKTQGQLKNNSLYVGASLIAIADYQKSNTDSKFAYLMRHPTSNNQIGKSVSEVVIHSAQLSFTSSINSWITGYGELLYNPEQSFGVGTITSLGRNQIQFRKGIVLLGNLDLFPVYFAIGKMDVNFGQSGSVSPFTNSTMWHAFGGISYSALVGFKKYGIDASFTAIQGGAQFRAVNTPVDSTNVPSRVNNFALDLNYTIDLNGGLQAKIGASYLHGTSYCQGFPVVHFMPCGDNNPASSFYAMLNYNDRLTIKGSYAETREVWPGTFNPAPPLNVYPASKVSSLDIGAKYKLNTEGNIVYIVSAEFSNFKAGPEGSPWERQTQTVIGVSGMIQQSSKLFLEVFRTEGYSPLNFISGGNFEDPGVTHSDRDANSIGVVVGAMLTI